MATPEEEEARKAREARAALNPSRLDASPTPRLDATRPTAAPTTAGFPNNLRPNNAAMTGAPAPAMATTPTTNLGGRQALFADMRATAQGLEGSKTGSDFRDRAKALGIDDAAYARGIGRAEGTLPFTKAMLAAPASGDLKQAYGNYKANQPMQSTSSLSGSIGKIGETRTLGTESGAMRTEARRLRKQGYSAAAQQMALGASTARLNEPRILTQEQRGRMGMQAQESAMASQEAAAAQAEQAKYMRDLYKKRQADLDKGITPPYSTELPTSGTGLIRL
jgi:hypothetical protein